MERFTRRGRSSVVAASLTSLLVLSSGVRAFGQVSAAFEQAYQSGTPTTVRGRLSAIVSDDFARHRSETVHTIRDAETGRRFTLRLDKRPARGLAAGTTVTISGRAHGSQLYVRAESTQLYAQTSESTAPMALSGTASAPAVSGDQRTLVMLVNFANASLACTPEAISELMFSATSGTSVDAMYRDSSFGAVTVSGAVLEPLTIQASSTDACDEEGWADSADAATAAAGVNPEAFARRFYVMPSSSCPAAGIGDLGGSSTRAWVFACNLVDVYAHELGHNLGMNHASTPTSEYGDYSDFMSVGLGRPRQVNGAHKLQMGWIPTSQVASPTEDGSYDVRTLELAPDASMPQLLKIGSTDSAGAFYLSYRRPIGVDTDLCCTYVDRLNIHRWAGGGAKSYLVATLSDGETYTDPVSGFSVKQLGHDDLGATGRVQMGTLCAMAPTLTLTPRDQSLAAATEAVYEVSVTNNDGPSCPASQFSVAGAVPAGWSSVLSQSSVQLAPSTSAQLSWRVASTVNAAPGSYSVTLSSTDANTTVHSESAVGSYTVVQPCLDAPTMNLSPSNQTASSGTKVNYVVALTNHDRAGCPATTFVLTPTVPAGWTASLSTTTVTLSPGASSASTLAVSSPAAASAGTYGVWTHVSGGGNPMHDASSSGSYTVAAGDTVPPAAPTALAAAVRRKQVAVSWRPATDNVGVTGYRVLRNAVVTATTTATSWTDSAVPTGVPNTYSVVAFDAAGNTSAPSNAATVTITGGKK